MMSNETTEVSGWFTAGITVVATLSSVVAFLFKLRENENAKRIEELKNDFGVISVKANKCEEERVELKTECASMRGEIEVLKTKLAFIDVNGTKFSHQVLPKGDA